MIRRMIRCLHLPQMPVVVDTHPIELALCAVLVFQGIRGIVFHYVSPSVNALPTPVWFTYLAVSMLGGAITLAGLVITSRAKRDYDALATGLRLERAGLHMVAASYASLGFIVVSANGRAGLSTGILVGIIAFACWRRSKAIAKATNVVLRELRNIRQGGGGTDA